MAALWPCPGRRGTRGRPLPFAGKTASPRIRRGREQARSYKSDAAIARAGVKASLLGTAAFQAANRHPTLPSAIARSPAVHPSASRRTAGSRRAGPPPAGQSTGRGHCLRRRYRVRGGSARARARSTQRSRQSRDCIGRAIKKSTIEVQ